MILRTFLHEDPVGISYLAACGTVGLAAIIDPAGAIEPYLHSAARAGARIRYVIDTHLHADHVSSGRELAAATGAEYVLSANADVAYPFRGVGDGEVLEAGNTRLRVMFTPGHTPEHIALVVTDLRRWRRSLVRDHRPHPHGRRLRAHRARGQRRGGSTRPLPDRAALRRPPRLH